MFDLEKRNSVFPTRYPQKFDGKPDLVITSRHGVGSDFLDQHPGLLETFHPDDLPHLKKYFDVEYDHGATQLAHEIARILSHIYQFRVIVIECTFTRGLLDMHRVREHAFMNVLSYGYRERLYELFMTKCVQAQSFIREEIESAGGVCLDIHTMSDFNIAEKPELKPGNLGAFADAWNDPDNRVSQRQSTFVTGLNGNEHDETRYLRQALQTHLRRDYYKFSRNDPYHSTDLQSTAPFVRSGACAVLDICKSEISNEDPYSDGYDLSQLTLSLEKISRLASCIAAGVNDVSGTLFR